MAARLEALENDNQAEDPFAADSGDDEFVLRDDCDEGRLFNGCLAGAGACWSGRCAF